jgi:hypothetical protein
MDDSQSPNHGHDGKPVINPLDPWMWVKVDSIEITNAAGIHTFNVRRRESGYRLDRIVLRQSSAVPTGDGPPESEQGSIATKIEGEEQALPQQYELYDNYPNPFNPSTTISFALPQKSFVTIEIYDILGQKVTTLFDGLKEAGFHGIVWATDGISSGLYVYRFTAEGVRGDNFSAFRKCVLIK